MARSEPRVADEESEALGPLLGRRPVGEAWPVSGNVCPAATQEGSANLAPVPGLFWKVPDAAPGVGPCWAWVLKQSLWPSTLGWPGPLSPAVCRTALRRWRARRPGSPLRPAGISRKVLAAMASEWSVGTGHEAWAGPDGTRGAQPAVHCSPAWGHLPCPQHLGPQGACLGLCAGSSVGGPGRGQPAWV